MPVMKRATEGSAGHSGVENKETRQSRTDRQMDKQAGDVDIDQLYTCYINAQDYISHYFVTFMQKIYIMLGL